MASLETNLNFLLIIISMAALSASARQFQVGGERGWVIPTSERNLTYNDWAAHNRFHINDTLYFRYQNDSVLVVDSKDYQNCITSNPIAKFEDGFTVFQFNRSGFFYFISGLPGHCKSGQKMTIRVMHPSELHSPESAPSPDDDDDTRKSGGRNSSDSDNWGLPALNSAAKLAIASYFTSALGGNWIVHYMFM